MPPAAGGSYSQSNQSHYFINSNRNHQDQTVWLKIHICPLLDWWWAAGKWLVSTSQKAWSSLDSWRTAGCFAGRHRTTRREHTEPSRPHCELLLLHSPCSWQWVCTWTYRCALRSFVNPRLSFPWQLCYLHNSYLQTDLLRFSWQLLHLRNHEAIGFPIAFISVIARASHKSPSHCEQRKHKRDGLVSRVKSYFVGAAIELPT